MAMSIENDSTRVSRARSWQNSYTRRFEIRGVCPNLRTRLVRYSSGTTELARISCWCKTCPICGPRILIEFADRVYSRLCGVTGADITILAATFTIRSDNRLNRGMTKVVSRKRLLDAIRYAFASVRRERSGRSAKSNLGRMPWAGCQLDYAMTISPQPASGYAHAHAILVVKGKSVAQLPSMEQLGSHLDKVFNDRLYCQAGIDRRSTYSRCSRFGTADLQQVRGLGNYLNYIVRQDLKSDDQLNLGAKDVSPSSSKGFLPPRQKAESVECMFLPRPLEQYVEALERAGAPLTPKPGGAVEIATDVDMPALYQFIQSQFVSVTSYAIDGINP